MGFLLASPDDAVIWRGPKKNGEQTIHRGMLLMDGNW